MALTLTTTFDPLLSRVQITVTGAGASASYVLVERSTDGIRWTTVRGAAGLGIGSSGSAVSDYEFPASVAVTYRATSYSTAGAVVDAAVTKTLTCTQDLCWLKDPVRPFMNRAVKLLMPDPGDGPVRKSRSTTFDIVGSPVGVAVNDVHTGRERTIRLLANDRAESLAIVNAVTQGGVAFFQAPPACPVSTMYGNVGDVTVAHTTRFGSRRIVSIPLTEVAAPSSTVAPFGGTWQTVTGAYASWSALAAAQSSWQSLAQLVGSPTDIVVG